MWPGGCSRQYMVIKLRPPCRTIYLRRSTFSSAWTTQTSSSSRSTLRRTTRWAPPSARQVFRPALAADSAVSAFCVPSSTEASLQAHLSLSSAESCMLCVWPPSRCGVSYVQVYSITELLLGGELDAGPARVALTYGVRVLG